jgi:ORF6N domain
MMNNTLGNSDAWRMVNRRASAAGIQTKIGNHTFRATGITAYLKNGGRLEIAQQIACAPNATSKQETRRPITNPIDIPRGSVPELHSLTIRRSPRNYLVLTVMPEPGKSVGMAKRTKQSAKHIAAYRPVESLIRVIRGQKVMLDRDLAELYGVSTGALNQGVRRNLDRFPEDFMFQLTKEEVQNLKSQSVTSSWGGRRKAPSAFTEHGVAMLSAVLRSDRAVQMSIGIIRAFVRMRQLIEHNRDIAVRVEKLERSHDRSASVIEILVEDIDRLAHEVNEMKALPPVTKRKIGFHLGDDQ